MSRAAVWLLAAGALLFTGILISQGLPAVLSTLSHAGWGLVLVAAFHLLPLVIDAAAIAVLFERRFGSGALRESVLARWVGESANSLMPAGQLGGPVLMARHLARRGMGLDDAAAAITISTTMQTFAQIMFALVGILVLGAQAGHLSEQAIRTTSLVASAFLAVQVGGFYWLQRRGLFSKLTGALMRLSAKRDWSALMNRAKTIDAAVQSTYDRGAPILASLLLNFLGWFVGVGEVYLIASFLGTPVSWTQALLLESVGQAIRGAGFAIPGALGVQEGGYLLLAPLAGLPPSAGVALSLAKRARELLLGLPGLLYLHFDARQGARSRSVVSVEK
jgi:putative membrane protein